MNMNLLQVMFFSMPSGGGNLSDVSPRNVFIVMVLAFLCFVLPSLIIALKKYVKHKKEYPTVSFDFIDDVGFLPSAILAVYSFFAVALIFVWICTFCINYLN